MLFVSHDYWNATQSPLISYQIFQKSCTHVCVRPLKSPTHPTAHAAITFKLWNLFIIIRTHSLLMCQSLLIPSSRTSFLKNHWNPYGLRCHHHLVSLWIHNCRFLFVSSCWGFRQTGGWKQGTPRWNSVTHWNSFLHNGNKIFDPNSCQFTDFKCGTFVPANIHDLS